ncbi:MAG: dihydropteroate synthase-like protein [Methanomicrobiales archaeon]|nr:dihydropteroate synthase-like protein [Methanomicrobiales archaeon]
MRILLPTGMVTAPLVREAAEGLGAEVVVTGEVAAFLTPARLLTLVRDGQYDMVIVSGMCTASFDAVEEATGVPIFLGPRHAADLGTVLARLGEVTLSRRVPADTFLAAAGRAEAEEKIAAREEQATWDFLIRGTKIGGNSRIKVLAEVMDSQLLEDPSLVVSHFFAAGADIVDLGFGFDATPDDVSRVFSRLMDVEGPLAVDTQDAALIRAALVRADLVISLHEETIPLVGQDVADAGAGAVVVPGARGLEENVRAAERTGISCIIADPLLMPVGSGLINSLARFRDYGCPLFFGAGNVVELLDADSPGANALLAGMAMEVGASVIFTSENSDKTRGSVAEMRRATEMMALMGDRPYPKDLGIDLFLLKEKRRRREPPLVYRTVVPATPMPREVTYDPCGNFRIGIEGEDILAVLGDVAYRGQHWGDIFYSILEGGDVSRLDHAAYLGHEISKAELAVRFGRSFEQDGEF